MADNNEDVKVSSSIQPVQEDKPKEETSNTNASSANSALVVEDLKRYVDQSLAKFMDDIIKADKAKQESNKGEPAKETEKEETW